MAENTLEYASVFQQELDRQMIAGTTSGWMEENAGAVQYNGGSEVKVPVVTMDGLADYDRNAGYVDGAVSLAYKTMGMTMDRGAFTLLDMAERLYRLLAFIPVNGVPHGGTGMRHTADDGDGVLHFYVDYNLHLREIPDLTMMEALDVQVEELYGQ